MPEQPGLQHPRWKSSPTGISSDLGYETDAMMARINRLARL